MDVGDGLFWLLVAAVGIVYAAGVHVAQAQWPQNPYTSLWVVGGVLVSLGLGAAVLDGQTILVVLGIFAATGLWQVLGSMWRWQRRQQAGRDAGAIRQALEE